MTHKPLPLRKLTMQEHQKFWWARYGHIVNALNREKRAEARAAKAKAVDPRFKVKPLPKEKKHDNKVQA